MSTNEINKFIKRNKIEQLVLSKSLISNKTLADSFDVDNVNYDSKKTTLFWGLYSFEEINKVKSHFGKKFILWGGNDCLPSKYEYLKDLKNILIHICLDRSTFENLKSLFKKVYNLNEFEWNLYLETYPSLKKHIKNEELARLHYERIGIKIKEGKSIYGGIVDSDFDWKFYVNYYEDLKIIRNEYDAWKHYLIFGKAENRFKNNKSLEESKDNSEDSKLFDWILYSRSYPSLKLNNKIQAYSHWIKYGKKEGRNLFGGNIDDSFDWKFYINKYQDLTYVKSEREAWIHYVKYGKLEGRSANKVEAQNEIEKKNFDWILYNNSYDDINFNNFDDAWVHWINYGKKEGRNSIGGEIDKEFDWNFYVNRYDFLGEIKSEEEAWKNYVKYGKNEDNDINCKIKYHIVKNSSNKKNKLWAHLHCNNIDLFIEIYQKYINEILKHFNIIVTYTNGTYIPPYNFTIIKIKNKGMDVGAKICAIKFLQNENINYDYILFLHSKSNELIRNYIFDKFINNIHHLTSKKYEYDLIIHDLLSNGDWEKGVYTINKAYINWYNNKLGYKLLSTEFSQINMVYASKLLVNKTFFNLELLYSLCNDTRSIDYNWININYKLNISNYKELYKIYKKRNLKPNHLAARNQKNVSFQTNYDNIFNGKYNDKLILNDGGFEHLFERLWVNNCLNNNMDFKILR